MLERVQSKSGQVNVCTVYKPCVSYALQAEWADLVKKTDASYLMWHTGSTVTCNRVCN